MLLFIFVEPKLPGPSVGSANQHTSVVAYVCLSALLVVFVAPILEELLFRGILYAPVARKIGAWKAVVLLSLVGGLWHLDHTFAESFGNIVLSLLLYYTYVKSRSLYPPTIWHVAVNFNSIRSDVATALVGYIDSHALDGYYIWGISCVLLIINSLWLATFLTRADLNQR